MHQEKGKKNRIYKEIKLIFFRPLSIQSIGKVNRVRDERTQLQVKRRIYFFLNWKMHYTY